MCLGTGATTLCGYFDSRSRGWWSSWWEIWDCGSEWLCNVFSDVTHSYYYKKTHASPVSVLLQAASLLRSLPAGLPPYRRKLSLYFIPLFWSLFVLTESYSFHRFFFITTVYHDLQYWSSLAFLSSALAYWRSISTPAPRSCEPDSMTKSWLKLRKRNKNSLDFSGRVLTWQEVRWGPKIRHRIIHVVRSPPPSSHSLPPEDPPASNVRRQGTVHKRENGRESIIFGSWNSRNHHCTRAPMYVICFIQWTGVVSEHARESRNYDQRWGSRHMP